MRRLFFDIETSPNLVWSWRTGRKINISHDSIYQERAIICIAYKWAGEKKVHSLKWDSKQNDKAMLKKFVKVLDSATEICGHNGDNFDLKWVRTRCLYHGIPMAPDYVSQDTLKLAKSKFLFNSNRLDYIADYLGYGKKKPTGFKLWTDIVGKKCPKAMKTMIDYCKHDVVLLEQIWDRFMTYVPAKSSVAEYISRCPECGSDQTIVNKRRVTASGYSKVQFRCNDCGKYHTVAAGRFDKDKKEEEQ
jgi:predicted PolB exonuclease-like 3'-5' exonuclease